MGRRSVEPARGSHHGHDLQSHRHRRAESRRGPGGAFDSGTADFQISDRPPDSGIDHRSYSIGFRVAITGREDARTGRVVESLETLASGLAADPGGRAEAAEIWAALGEWQADKADAAEAAGMAERSARAAANFAKAVELDPNNLGLSYRHALLLAASGQRDAYRSAGVTMLARFGHLRGPGEVSDVIRACSLLPTDDARSDSLLRLAEGLEASAAKDPRLSYALVLAAHRAGKIDLAVKYLRPSLGATAWHASPLTWPLLALAQNQRGHPGAARRWLEMARSYDRNLQTPAGRVDPGGMTWWECAEFRLLLREAEATAGFPAPELPVDVFAH